MAKCLDANRPLGTAASVPPRWESIIRHLARAASVSIAALGFLVLLGWTFDVSILKSGYPSLPMLKANAAVLFVLLGSGLGCAGREGAASRARRALGLVIALIAGITFAQYPLRTSFGIDELLFRDPAAARYPGRMAPTAALYFLLLGLALWLKDSGVRFRVSQAAALLVALGALLGLCGYLYGVRSLYEIGVHAPISLHASLGFLVACGALLCAHPTKGVVGIFMSNTSTGQLLRRIQPAVILVPMVIGWLCLRGELSGYYGRSFGLAIMVLAMVILPSLLTWGIVPTLLRADRSREELRELSQNLELRVEERTHELALANERLDGIISAAADAIVSSDDQQRITIFNKGAEDVFGWAQGEVLGRPLEILLPERLRETHRQHVATFAVEPIKARRMGERRAVLGLRKSGEEFPAEAAISRLAQDAGHVFTVILRDISERLRIDRERKHLEDELKRSESKFRTLAEAMPQMVWITRPDGWNVYFNRQWVKYTGLSLEESYGHGWNIPFHPDDRQRAWHAWQQAVQTDGVYSIECRLRRQDGTYRWWLIRGVSLHDEGGQVLNWVGTCTDVDDIKRTEVALRQARDQAEAASEKLRTSEERFRLTIDEAPIGMALVALDGRFVRVNRALCEIVGYSSAELLELSFQDITHLDDLAVDVSLAGQLARGEIPRYQLEKRYFRKDGTIVDVLLSASILRDQGGAPLYYIAQLEDITERKRAETAIKGSEERLNLALESAQMGIWDLDVLSDSSVRSLRHDQIFGYSALLPRWGTASFMAHVVPDDRPSAQQSFAIAFASGIFCLECRVLWPNKSIHWISAQGRVVSRDPRGSPLRMLGTIVDITEHKRMEEERARTLKERETLLKEIHHRVKNNLQVLSSLFYLQRQRTAAEPLRTLLDESRNRIQSIALIHEKLYQSEHLARIDFGDYLKDLTAGLQRAIGTQAPQARISILADNVFLDIERAIPCALIVNELVTNSLKHAFPGGRRGEVRITAAPVTPDLFELVVSDTGIGFPAELDFTNTDTLGMKLVCSLTTQLRGTVNLHRDGGTRFAIRFSVPPGT